MSQNQNEGQLNNNGYQPSKSSQQQARGSFKDGHQPARSENTQTAKNPPKKD